jgi:predicted 3-demethylubiquinone-9 3-methyltransferase (glyoxalase superfamily)
MFKFNEAVSFYIECNTQEEIDYYWEKLTADGGEPSQCGWLKDKFGLSWQVASPAMMELWQSPDKERATRAMQAMMKMTKIEIDKLQAAANG